MGLIVPISLLAYITETIAVLSHIALDTISGVTMPFLFTSSHSIKKPSYFSRCNRVFVIAGCSAREAKIHFAPVFSRIAYAAPRIARLSDSEPQDVNIISSGLQFNME